jgi:TamB, inner membrane protein subunit of TAM complex
VSRVKKRQLPLLDSKSVVLGRTILSGGDLLFVGNRYQVQSGRVVFANPICTEPTFNLFVTTTVQQCDITLNLVRSPDRLRSNFMSHPSLPLVDIIHLLTFGKTVAGSAQTVTPTLGAQSVIANRLASEVSSRIEKLTGISQLQVNPSLGGNNRNAGARLTVVQHVTGNILVTFSTYLNSTPKRRGAGQVSDQRKALSFSLIATKMAATRSKPKSERFLTNRRGLLKQF